MSSRIEEMVKEWDSITEEKRKKVLEKIKTLDGAELQVIYQSIFFDEIMKSFDQLPTPTKQLTVKEIDEAIFRNRKESGFYTKNSD